MSVIDNIRARGQARKNAALWKIIAKRPITDLAEVRYTVEALMEIGWPSNATDQEMADSLIGVVSATSTELLDLIKVARMLATLALVKK